MAKMIPDSLEDKVPYGEKRVFELLKHLPDTCIVYHEPKIGNLTPDFVVVMRTAGVLIIEVKGWYLDDIDGADIENVSLKKSMACSTSHGKHPVKQAKEYKNVFLDQLKRYPELLQQSGKYRGYPVFPVWQIAVLSHIERQGLSGKNADGIFPETEVITRDELDRLESVCGDSHNEANLLEILKAYFPAKEPNLRWDINLTNEQVAILDAILFPRIGEIKQSAENVKPISFFQNIKKAILVFFFGYRCPSCGAKMVRRQNRQDGSRFWGCSNYPECKNTLRDRNGKPVYLS